MQEILVAVITGGLALVGVVITNVAGQNGIVEFVLFKPRFNRTF